MTLSMFRIGSSFSLARWLVAAVCFVPAAGVAAPASLPPQPLQLFRQVHPAMGTEYTLELYARNQAFADQAMNLAFEEIDRLDALLSNYKPASELSRITREAAVHPVTTDPETFHFLDRSLYWSRQSNGAFDITVGPLLRAWGFFFKQGRVPSDAELAAVRDRVGWQNVLLDPAQRTVVFLDHKAVDLDPGSIGKGFAVDQVVALLRGLGVESAFLSAGGSTLYGIGTAPGLEGWPVLVPDPRQPGAIASTILLKDTSLSTGACTEKFFVYKGHRYCHIFDPRTMRPVEGVLQTSVISPSATDSDALSTVVFVATADESRELLAPSTDTRALIFRAASSPNDCIAIHWPGSPCARLSTQLQPSMQLQGETPL
jgi:FAD:protein FMN transferase